MTTLVVCSLRRRIYNRWYVSFLCLLKHNKRRFLFKNISRIEYIFQNDMSSNVSRIRTYLSRISMRLICIFNYHFLDFLLSYQGKEVKIKNSTDTQTNWELRGFRKNDVPLQTALKIQRGFIESLMYCYYNLLLCSICRAWICIYIWLTEETTAKNQAIYTISWGTESLLYFFTHHMLMFHW